MTVGVEAYCSLEIFLAIFFFFYEFGIYVKIAIYFVHEDKFHLFVATVLFMRQIHPKYLRQITDLLKSFPTKCDVLHTYIHRS